MDWKETKTRLDELARQAREQKNEVGLLVSDSIGAIEEQLDHVHQNVSHVAERLDALTSQLAELEARVHEDVE
jgi:polyhydroxyalkanoate synthesis regulator phasin